MNGWLDKRRALAFNLSQSSREMIENRLKIGEKAVTISSNPVNWDG